MGIYWFATPLDLLDLQSAVDAHCSEYSITSRSGREGVAHCAIKAFESGLRGKAELQRRLGSALDIASATPHHQPFRKSSADAEIVRLLPALRAFARTFQRSETDADDLVQDTLTRALASIDHFEPGTRMKSWLFTIMRNAFYTTAKRRKREAPGLLDCVSGSSSKEAVQEWSIRSREVYDAIQNLPRSQREVIVLIGVLGTSYEDTARICGCAMGTVKSRLNRARRALLHQLQEPCSNDLLQPSVAHLTFRFEADTGRQKLT